MRSRCRSNLSILYQARTDSTPPSMVLLEVQDTMTIP
jgi:hypothetical protein